MEITDITFYSLKKKSNGVCAECTVELDKSIAIHRIKIIEGAKGLYVAMPNSGVSYITKSGKRKILDVVHPTNSEFQQMFDKTILDRYLELKKD